MNNKDIFYNFYYTKEGSCLFITMSSNEENSKEWNNSKDYVIINQDTYKNLLDGKTYTLKSEFMDSNPRLCDISAFIGEEQVCGYAINPRELEINKDEKIKSLEERILKLEKLLKKGE